MTSIAPKLLHRRIQLVLVGSLSPDDAKVEHLIKVGALTSDDNANVLITSLLPNQIVEYNFGWGSIQALHERLTIATTESPAVRIADLAQKVVREAMPTARFYMMGINSEFHFQYSSTLERDQFALRLVPIKAWGTWGESIQMDLTASEVVPRSGLVQLTMRKVMKDRDGGWVDVAISPSERIAHGLGVRLHVNDHYQFNSNQPNDSGEDRWTDERKTHRLLELLSQNFDESLKRALSIATELSTL